MDVIETAKGGKLRAQFSSLVVDHVNKIRFVDEINQLNIQNGNFSNAVEQLDKVREFVGSPENILGSSATKHGEIAEHVEVGVRRAKQALDGNTMTATFEGVSRTAPEDYLVDGVAVQAKFINGTNNNLLAVMEHMDKYASFGRDGSYYHIPKDEYAVIEKIRNNESVEQLNQKTVTAIKEKIAYIEAESGKPFNEVVKPSVSGYADVQQGEIDNTLADHEKLLSDENELKKEQITQDKQASFSEGAKAAGVAAAVGATISLTISLYQKSKEGKCFYKGDLSAEDWKEIGITTTKGAAVGAVAGAAIYGLTNYASLSAPFAGAVVSATKGIGSLASDWEKGEINQEEFIELGMIVCAEAAIVGFATVASQAAIPIPVLGAIMGSIAGSMLANFLGEKNKKTARVIRAEMESYLNKLDDEYQKLVFKITADFDHLGGLTKAAFNLENNTNLLEYSITLARSYGVEDNKIVKSISELDEFMLS